MPKVSGRFLKYSRFRETFGGDLVRSALRARGGREVLIASVEEGNEAERIRNLYEADKELSHLRSLVARLFNDKNFAELTKYAPILVKEDKREEDYELAQKAFFFERKYKEFIELAETYPELHARRDEFASVLGWTLFHLGRVIQARAIARELVNNRSRERLIPP